MRILYFIFKILLQYPVRLFYPRIKLINPHKEFFSRTIYVCNHAASFMDPLMVTVPQRPIVFFMTRSDVFKKWLQPILWSVHMLPIYREQDGVDTKSKNEEVFKKCNRILFYGRSLLIFGEGFTDDVFVRRLKPVKKGAIRIGFGALEYCKWEKQIYMACVGINYSDPNYFGGDLLLSNSERICLNDYKEKYVENPTKTIAEITKLIEKMLQNQLTHVENKNWVFFHEQVCRLKRNGMNPEDTDFSIPLKKRWENSRQLALWFNEQDLENNSELIQLKDDTQTYFNLLKRMKLEEKFVYELTSKKKLSTTNELLLLIISAIFVPLGLIHFFIPYIFVKRFAEKTFKRRVFWSSIKMMMGAAVLTLFNIPLIILLQKLLFHNVLISWIYFLILPIVGVITYSWFRKLKDFKSKKVLQKLDLSSFVKKRNELLEKISDLIPA